MKFVKTIFLVLVVFTVQFHYKETLVLASGTSGVFTLTSTTLTNTVNYSGCVSGINVGLALTFSQGNLISTNESRSFSSLSGTVTAEGNLHFSMTDTSSNLTLTWTGYGTVSSGTYTFFNSDGNGCEYTYTGSWSESSVTSSSSQSLDKNQFDAIQENEGRKQITNQVVDTVFVDGKPQPPPAKKLAAKASVNAAANVKIFNIPVSYRLDDKRQISGSLPVAFVNQQFLLGNLSATYTTFNGDVSDQMVLTNYTGELPTGSKEIGAGGFNLSASQVRIRDFDEKRGVLSYSYRYTSTVDSIDTGDSITIVLGLNTPLKQSLPLVGKNYTLYGLTTIQNIGESTYAGSGLGDGRTLIDLTTGLIWTPLDLRVGLNFPLITMSNQISNSDRLISLDIGFKFGGSLD